MVKTKKIHKWIGRLQRLLADDEDASDEQLRALEKALSKLRKREAELTEALKEAGKDADRQLIKQRRKLVRRHLEKGQARLEELKNPEKSAD